MKRRVLGSRFYFSYSDGQVENKCHGETGPLSAYKWSFQNTHQTSWRNALVQGKREKPFSVLCLEKFLQYVSGKTQQGQRCLDSFRSCTDGARYYESCCLYSAVYLLLMKGKFQILKVTYIGIRAGFLNFPFIECDLVSGFCSFDLCEPGFVKSSLLQSTF